MNAQLLQTVQLVWSPSLRVTRAEGDCSTVLHRSVSELADAPLHVVLGTTPERARELDARAREDRRAVEFVSSRVGTDEPTPLRLVLGLEAGEATAAIQDLDALLDGAPPVQISRLSSSLSHEIRNPLSSVKMAVQTLQRNTTLSDRDKRRLTIANREIRTMERMLWLLSEYGRDSVPHLEQQPLRNILQEAHGMVAPELAERRIELSVVEDPELPRVSVDTARLRPVLAQLLLNIAMGLPEDSHVDVQLLQGPAGRARMVLKDPTAALPPEERGTLFEPFGSRLARGAGLSLAALRRVMLNQAGDITAEGSAEPGMVFTLTFAV
ncbi:HAMP domain-containing sensor histidine kinase [Hyalangium sp.]|uniref:sensor histidine kinase n=1 Tax=Hyalangium sp. TaxID=2028555 RepID=UPI002D694981|nr:HAMP domain-containing sensor histidine kinase [Hyalangium sp.]HYI02106.1 HAMP domain-containing sensor histidine kinase [Hyalangium sp.]